MIPNRPALQVGDDSRKNWRRINEHGGDLHDAEVRVRSLESLEGRRRIFAELDQMYFPFRVYVFPSGKRSSPDSDTDWRKFRVRNGAVVGNTATPIDTVAGTDGAEYPDDLTESPLAESDVADVAVASGTSAYWFWLEIDEGSVTATIEHGASPPSAWTLTVILIAKVDTNTHAAEKRALVRQYLRTDVIIPCLEFPAE